MATYPFLIYGEGLPPYWHNLDFATSAEMVSYVEGMVTSGDIVIGTDDLTSKVTYSRVPAVSIQKIKVYYP